MGGKFEVFFLGFGVLDCVVGERDGNGGVRRVIVYLLFASVYLFFASIYL